MAWGDDWTAAGYALKSADVLALYNALRERGDVLRDYVYYPASRIDAIATLYPLGVGTYHNPFDVAHPEYIPAHLQAFDLWNGYRLAIYDMIGTPGNPSYPAAFDTGNDLDGKAMGVADFTGGHGAFTSFFGVSYFGGYPADYDPIGSIRARAGLPLNYGRTTQNDGWRRRCPRFVLAGALAVPQDRDGNAAVDGQRAWEITNDFAYLPTRASGDIPTGRLMQWNGAAGAWQYRGQAGGEMPDMLDSTLAPPNNTPPGSGGGTPIYHGDYLGAPELNEIKQVVKKLVAWGWAVGWGDSESKTGQDLSNVSYTLAKSNATANYNAAAVSAGSGGQPYQFAYGGWNGSGTPYSARVQSNRAKMQAAFNNRLARSLRWYAGASLYNEPGGGIGTENLFDNAGLTYSVNHVWKLADVRAATAAADIPHGAGVAPDMVSNWVGQLATLPAYPAFPFAGNTDRYAGWEIHYGVAVADYSGAFAYT